MEANDILSRKKISIEKFEEFLNAIINLLQKNAYKEPSKFLDSSGIEFENLVFFYMDDLSKNDIYFNDFNNRIEFVSGLKFPDIVIDKKYGIEVKSSKNNSWKTTGNSVFEGNRVSTVINIYIIFAKLTETIEFRWKRLEECIEDVRVTHSPRYGINMNLEPGQTFFDKINVSYNIFRNEKDKIINYVREYYSKQLNFEYLWWLEEKVDVPVNLIFFNSLDENKRKYHLIYGLLYFPEILSNSHIIAKTGKSKFDGFVSYLINKHGIICHNIRDHYTAGGALGIKYHKFKDAPHIFKFFLDDKELILDIISEISTNTNLLDKKFELKEWIKKALDYTSYYKYSKDIFRSIFSDYNL